MKYSKHFPLSFSAKILSFLPFLCILLLSARAQTCLPASNVHLSQINNTQLTVAWNASSTAIGYEVRYQTNLGQTITNTTSTNMIIQRTLFASFEIIGITAICNGGVKAKEALVLVEGVIIAVDDIWQKQTGYCGVPKYSLDTNVIIKDLDIDGSDACVITKQRFICGINDSTPEVLKTDHDYWNSKIIGLLSSDTDDDGYFDAYNLGIWGCPEYALIPPPYARVGSSALSSLNWSIAPNPFSDYVSIGLQLESAQVPSIHIVDLMGRKVLSIQLKEITSGQYETKLNTSSLAAGVYQVILHTANGIQAKKMIKQ